MNRSSGPSIRGRSRAGQGELTSEEGADRLLQDGHRPAQFVILLRLLVIPVGAGFIGGVHSAQPLDEGAFRRRCVPESGHARVALGEPLGELAALLLREAVSRLVIHCFLSFLLAPRTPVGA